MNETLEAMARAMFKDWFVDFGPTKTKMEGRAPYLAPEIWDLFPDRLDDEGKPEGWQESPLDSFFAIIGGGTPKTTCKEYWGGAIPWFSVVDAPTDGDVYVIKTEKNITPQGLANSSARIIPPGITIISARGTVGRLAMAAQEMAFNQSCYGLKSLPPVGDIFVYLAAKHMVSKLKQMSHGAVFSTITRQTFNAISLPLPPATLLQEFESTACSLFDQIKANVNESQTLAQTRDLLLPKLMSGEIRVKDAERAVEDKL
jgi:type I restriction enzyme S subunit